MTAIALLRPRWRATRLTYRYPLSTADSKGRREFRAPWIGLRVAQFRRGSVSPTMDHPP